MVRLTFVAPTVLFALQALAVAEPVGDSLASAFIRRQLGGTPTVSGSDSSDCQSQCKGYLDAVTGCQNSTDYFSCYCTQTLFNNLGTCLDCALAVDSSLSQQDEQTVVNDLASDCKGESFSVNAPTLKASKNAASLVKVCGLGLFAAVAASVMLA